MWTAFILYSHSLFARGLETLLQGQNGVTVTGVELQGDEAFAHIKILKPDVIIVEGEQTGDGCPMRAAIVAQVLRQRRFGVSVEGVVGEEAVGERGGRIPGCAAARPGEVWRGSGAVFAVHHGHAERGPEELMGSRRDRALETWERLCRAARHWGGEGVCELAGSPPALLWLYGSTMIEASREPVHARLGPRGGDREQQQRDADGNWSEGPRALMPARSILIAAGTQPNTVLSREDPAHFSLDGRYFELRNEDGSIEQPPRGLAKPARPAVLTTLRDDGRATSFFGDLHGQGMDAVEFFTQKKVVIERWPKEWSRKF